MNENRLPPGYVPLTIHELNAPTIKQGTYRRSEGGDQRPRKGGSGGGKGGGGRMNNRRRPRPEERDPIEE
jgi:hypothetical protein